MKYKFFNNSEKVWRAMFEAVKEAEDSIYLEMFIFTDDMEKYDFFKLLKEKAESGVRVRIILDSLGSRGLSEESITSFKESGAELYFLKGFLHHTHRKILIVDETVAFLGGVNLSQSFKSWDDLSVRVRGRLVRPITKSFAKAYKKCGGEDEKILRLALPAQTKPKKTGIWLVEHFPVNRIFNLKKVYKKHLDGAKERITIITPYFVPKRWLVKALKEARRRGVEVEVLVPQETNHSFVNPINYFYMRKLSRAGIKFYLEPFMNHAKALVIDGEEGIVGSHNIDFLSFDFNDEIGLFFKDKGLVGKITEITEKWKKDSVLFDPDTHKLTWRSWFLSPVIGLFSKIF